MGAMTATGRTTSDAGVGKAATVLDASIDDAAHDGQKTIAARFVIMLLLAAIMAAHQGIEHATIWTVFVGASELGCRRASLTLRRHRGPRVSVRVAYLATAGLVSFAWSALPLWLWFTGKPALGASAIVILATQLIHGQAFTFRSVPVLVVTGGIPAAMLLALPWLFGPFTGLDRATINIVALLAIGYALASVHANRKTAWSLRSAQNELERFAYFDALTSLANRRRFGEDLRQLIALSRRRGTRFALVLLDLDRFKTVNDTFGHDAGDALLVEVGARLRRAVREGDLVARLGGDEFAILLQETGDATAIDLVCARIAATFADAVDFDGRQMAATPSVGVAMYPDDGERQDTLYKSADLALYEAKRAGRNMWRFSGAAQTASLRRGDIAANG